jgi:5-methylcytosine-specific restriction enzyme subunit McrC
VLKAALHRLLLKLTNASSKNLSHLNAAYYDMPRAIEEATSQDVADVRAFAASPAGLTRSYYSRAIDISLLVLSNRGISLRDFGDDIALDSFVVNFETVFEDYLRHALAARANAATHQVLDGNKEGKKPLFDDRNEPPAQPDIVISSLDSGKKLIAEVKYKDKPNRDDYNQAITYAVSYRTDRVILIHQNKPGTGAGLRHVGTTNGIAVDAYAFDLSSTDLASEERQLADLLFSAVG